MEQETEDDVWSEKTKNDMVMYHQTLVLYGMSFDGAAEFLQDVSRTLVEEFSN